MNLKDKMEGNEKFASEVAKRYGIPECEVCLVMDVSGSMGSLYANGSVRTCVALAMGAAMAVDDDGNLPVITLGVSSKLLGEMNLQNADAVMSTLERYSLEGGTNYGAAINAVMDKYAPKSGGFMGVGGGRKFSGTKPVLAIVFTDGNPTVGPCTTRALGEFMKEAAHFPIFFVFVGIGSENFTVLKALDDMDGRNFDNADFVEMRTVWDAQPEAVYEAFFKELGPKAIPEMKRLGLIPNNTQPRV